VKIYFAVLWLSLASPISLACGQAVSAPMEVSPHADAILTNADILQMASIGLSPEIIKAKIENSKCQFDTSTKALQDLKTAGIADSLILAMVSVPTQPAPPSISPQQIALHAAIVEEKRQASERCPDCIGIMISNFDPSSRSTTDNWLSKHQLDYMKERREKAAKDQLPHHFWTPKYKENADYIIVWSSAKGSRAYTTYTPHTATSTTSISGDVNATTTTRTTYYEPQENEWQFINVVATVYDRDGSKKYETFHQGNFRWSKPDKDCLVDALNYLTPKAGPK